MKLDGTADVLDVSVAEEFAADGDGAAEIGEGCVVGAALDVELTGDAVGCDVELPLLMRALMSPVMALSSTSPWLAVTRTAPLMALILMSPWLAVTVGEMLAGTVIVRSARAPSKVGTVRLTLLPLTLSWGLSFCALASASESERV